MSNRARRAATKALRSTLGFGAAKVASNDRLMRVVYDLVNEANFTGLSEHEEMLSDSVRVDAYHRGIARHVRPGDVVLDLGTGSGLLAFMASRAGARKVYAIEHSDFIDVAREVARLNRFTNIEFIQTNSREFLPPEPIDVVLHEQMGDELFNENLLENVLDLRDRALRPGGRVLPARFRLFLEPISMHEAMRVRRFWNIELPDDIDLGALESSVIAARFDTGRTEHLWARPGSVASTLAEPRPILEFDLGTLRGSQAIPTDYVIERTASRDAVVDGACVWFEAVFDDDIVLSTSPLSTNTSWGNRLFRLDLDVVEHQTLRLHLHMGQLVEPSTWSVEVL